MILMFLLLFFLLVFLLVFLVCLLSRLDVEVKCSVFYLCMVHMGHYIQKMYLCFSLFFPQEVEGVVAGEVSRVESAAQYKYVPNSV